MTVSYYIKDFLSRFGEVLESDVADICGIANLGADDEYCPNEHMNRIEYGIAKIGARINGNATSISESGFSKSWKEDSFRSFYASLCKKYGLKDELSNKPKLTFF